MGGEDPLEKEMATRSSILACEISWAEAAFELVSFRQSNNLWMRKSGAIIQTLIVN